MHLVSLVSRFIMNPGIRMGYLTKIGFYNNLSDEKYICKRFKAVMGYKLDLENISTFNEKLQWLKLYDRKPEYTMMVDKYLVKEYVANIIGKEYVIPTRKMGFYEKYIKRAIDVVCASAAIICFSPL